MLLATLNINLGRLRVIMQVSHTALSQPLRLQVTQQGDIQVQNCLSKYSLSRYLRLVPQTLSALRVRQVPDRNSPNNCQVWLSFVIDVEKLVQPLPSLPTNVRMPSNHEVLNDWVYCCGHALQTHMNTVSCNNKHDSLYTQLEQIQELLRQQSFDGQLLLEHPNVSNYIIIKVLNPHCIIAHSQLLNEQEESSELVFQHLTHVKFSHITLQEHGQLVRQVRSAFDYELVRLTDDLFTLVLGQLVYFARFCVAEQSTEVQNELDLDDLLSYL